MRHGKLLSHRSSCASGGSYTALLHSKLRVRCLETAGSQCKIFPFLSAGSELGKLPRAEDLQCVLKFSLSQEKARQLKRSGATNLLSLLSELAEKEAARVPSPSSVGSGLPVVQRKTAEKIWAGEYIDF